VQAIGGVSPSSWMRNRTNITSQRMISLASRYDPFMLLLLFCVTLFQIALFKHCGVKNELKRASPRVSWVVRVYNGNL